MTATAPAPSGALGPASRLSLPPLSVVPEDDEFLVGDARTGVFLSIPEVGVVALRSLEAGATIEEAALEATAFAGTDVNVLEFAQVLVDAGLAQAGDPVRAAPPVQRIRAEHVRPLFSPVAWTVYAACFAFSVAAFVLRPELWPSFEDWFFLPNPAAAAILTSVTGLAIAGVHEGFHWLGARAEGVGARFAVGRRLFFPVFETDLSQLWGVPRRRRYGPFLAGMAFNSVLLAASLGLRLAWTEGLLDLPPTLFRYLGLLVLLNVLGIGFQALVFLRTDLYAVLITALGCRNLYRVNFLYLKGKLWSLAPPEAAELADAHERDVRVARWFALLYVIGVAWAAWYFVRIFVPSTVVFAGWLFHGLGGIPLASSAFWQVAAIASLFGLQAVWPLVVFLRERRNGA
jgi:hypothetical protein